jgi:hypothetical protein
MLVAGITVFALIEFYGIEFGGRIWRRSWKELPLLTRRDDSSMPGHTTSNLLSIAVSIPLDELVPHGKSARDYHQLAQELIL